MDTQFKVGDLVRRVGFRDSSPFTVALEGEVTRISYGHITRVLLTKEFYSSGSGRIQPAGEEKRVSEDSIWELVNSSKHPRIKTKFLEGYNGV